uniref:Glycosyl transferase CAP10 domain-containing protein n=1 Tax=Chromera velia CCMP2878 TaxID=1169474 RepID=A0A0G4I2E3_9ALVE|eukprot:Cvel_10342.t1-p1 / transcript=Cvel_10342.t1 / gene=Cvel_10342 / organism=Chromera_velia_CCMP2878 / gene_product=hypothetical protein / transcript_product=hypothetical protein / location=Cvel_scaffold621:51455-54580(+) / protein_length=523 / sequence_SO=supercontig / SO=protein_coding / is_pseudo=false
MVTFFGVRARDAIWLVAFVIGFVTVVLALFHLQWAGRDLSGVAGRTPTSVNRGEEERGQQCSEDVASILRLLPDLLSAPKFPNQCDPCFLRSAIQTIFATAPPNCAWSANIPHDSSQTFNGEPWETLGQRSADLPDDMENMAKQFFSAALETAGLVVDPVAVSPFLHMFVRGDGFNQNTRAGLSCDKRVYRHGDLDCMRTFTLVGSGPAYPHCGRIVPIPIGGNLIVPAMQKFLAMIPPSAGLSVTLHNNTHYRPPKEPPKLDRHGRPIKGNKKFSAVPWSKKIGKAVWRGGNHSEAWDAALWNPSWVFREGMEKREQFPENIREYLVRMCKEIPKECDAEFMPIVPAQRMTTEQLSGYKYLLAVAGYEYAGLAVLALLSGSVTLLQNGIPQPWYVRFLVPWVHYVPIANDLSDLRDRILWLRRHDRRARRIALAGRQRAAFLFSETTMQCYGAAVFIVLLLELFSVFELDEEKVRRGDGEDNPRARQRRAEGNFGEAFQYQSQTTASLSQQTTVSISRHKPR